MNLPVPLPATEGTHYPRVGPPPNRPHPEIDGSDGPHRSVSPDKPGLTNAVVEPATGISPEIALGPHRKSSIPKITFYPRLTMRTAEAWVTGNRVDEYMELRNHSPTWALSRGPHRIRVGPLRGNRRYNPFTESTGHVDYRKAKIYRYVGPRATLPWAPNGPGDRYSPAMGEVCTWAPPENRVGSLKSRGTHQGVGPTLICQGIIRCERGNARYLILTGMVSTNPVGPHQYRGPPRPPPGTLGPTRKWATEIITGITRPSAWAQPENP